MVVFSYRPTVATVNTLTTDSAKKVAEKATSVILTGSNELGFFCNRYIILSLFFYHACKGRPSGTATDLNTLQRGSTIIKPGKNWKKTFEQGCLCIGAHFVTPLAIFTTNMTYKIKVFVI